MKFFPLTAFFLLCTSVVNSQALKKYPLSTSGCSIYNYCPITYKIDKSADSSQVYTGECKVGEVVYGVICVKLLNPVSNLIMAEDLLIAYLDYLKSSFDIRQAAGYGKGHRLNNNPDTRGILDYWEDAEKDAWKVKAWTDGKYIGVMYSYSKLPLPESKVNVYLDSFRLPGM